MEDEYIRKLTSYQTGYIRNNHEYKTLRQIARALSLSVMDVLNFCDANNLSLNGNDLKEKFGDSNSTS